jgi:hypothetical protein
MILEAITSVGVNYPTLFFAKGNYNHLCYYLPLMKQTNCSWDILSKFIQKL